MLTPQGVVPHEINFGLPFVPERLTSLAYTPIYPSLSAQERLSYNQSYALYMNEQTAAFELTLTDFMVAVANLECARPLRSALLRLVLDEERHAAGFQAINRRVRPDLYRDTDSVFVRPKQLLSRLTSRLLRSPALFPFPLWIILLLEERSLYYSVLSNQESHLLEPNFVRLHQLHAQDEDRHVSLDEDLIRLLWDSLPQPLRRLNAFLVRKSFAEFFYYPKRAALDILRVCFQGHRKLPMMIEQVRALRHHREFLASLYNRTTNPRTLRLMDRYPEFAPLANFMAGYQ